MAEDGGCARQFLTLNPRVRHPCQPGGLFPHTRARRSRARVLTPTAPGSRETEARKWLCPSTGHPKHLSEEVTSLQGWRRSELAYWSSVLVEGKLMSGRGYPLTHPDRKRQRCINYGQAGCLCGWPPRPTEGTQHRATLPEPAQPTRLLAGQPVIQNIC
ncbi:hypothetical protein HJG60_009635 [Phyllostomus discolor]|uniref:Uncharacterized protein n=1 Tax=Phyllostomus discolor TaxID=89673 RepID=A0A834B9M2_9CHIR|nr:hypothetical protein HJG60_009635 [Phyllostomus discolor]